MRIGPVLRRWRIVEEVTLRKMAAEIGTSAATLCRLEKGENVDGLTLVRVLAWLFADGIKLKEEG